MHRPAGRPIRGATRRRTAAVSAATAALDGPHAACPPFCWPAAAAEAPGSGRRTAARAMAEDVSQRVEFRLEVVTASEVTRLAVTGNFQATPWDLGTAHDLTYTEDSGGCCRLAPAWGVGGSQRHLPGCWAGPGEAAVHPCAAATR